MVLTKEMLGIQTSKSILYPDHHFFSSVYRGNDPRFNEAMRRIKELLDLQLVAMPYSPTHEAEADFYTRRDELMTFIRGAARGDCLKPSSQVEETQIVKAFQAHIANGPTSYFREEADALPSSIHDWNGPYCVSVCQAASGVDQKRRSKRLAVEALVNALSSWALSANTFEQDMEIEISGSGRLFVEAYARKAARLWSGDFSALIDSPASASVVEMILYVLAAKGMQAHADQLVPSFFRSRHFAEVPSQQLSARLFSAFKKRVREGAFPNPKAAQQKVKGVLFDVEHAATYVPYCQAFFTDRFMASLLNDKLVDVERTFGCKVFSVSGMPAFLAWLEHVKSRITPEHADALKWAYPERYWTTLAS